MVLKIGLRGIVLKLNSGRKRILHWSAFFPLVIAVTVLSLSLFLSVASNSYASRSFLSRYSDDLYKNLFQNHAKDTFLADLDRALWVKDFEPTTELDEIDIVVKDEDLLQSLAEKEALGQGAEVERHRAFFRQSDTPFLECKLSSRGSSSWHHQDFKPSLRLRFSKKGTSPGFRWLELNRPESVLATANWLPEQLGEGLGLLTAQSEHVRVFINRKFKGVYLRNLRPGDRLALDNGYLPGAFIKGDALDVRSIWAEPSRWNFLGDLTNTQERWFYEFLKLIRTVESHPSLRHRLGEFIDEEALAKFAALYIFCGTNHADDRHNQMFYLSTYYGKLRPVVWDPNGFGLLLPPETSPDQLVNKLVSWANWDPRFVHRRNEILYKLLQEDRAPKLAEETWKRISADLAADQGLMQLYTARPDEEILRELRIPYEGRVKSREVSPNQVGEYKQLFETWYQTRRTYLERYLNHCEYALRPNSDGEMEVACFGQVAVLAKNKKSPHKNLILYPGKTAEMSPKPAPLFYTLEGDAKDWTFFNAVTSELVTPSDIFPEPHAPLFTLPVGPTDLQREQQLLKLGPGPVTISENLFIDEDRHLVVRPGTHLKIAPGVSVVCRGQVTMEGTNKAPIRVTSSGTAPFGSFAILGKDSKGTTLRHVQMKGGSTAEFGGLHLKGMFNVYGCPEVSLSHCKFSENEIGDDAVNIALSEVEISHCTFASSPMDALDLDGCRARINRCQFIAAGNDGLDIMETDLELQDCRFSECGDKGLSIGEESRSRLSQSTFLKCSTGLELKDDSRTLVEACEFLNCDTGLRAYRKKWLFINGGYGLLSNSSFGECKSELEVDPHSRIWLKKTPLTSSIPAGVSENGEFRLGAGPQLRVLAQDGSKAKNK